MHRNIAKQPSPTFYIPYRGILSPNTLNKIVKRPKLASSSDGHGAKILLRLTAPIVTGSPQVTQSTIGVTLADCKKKILPFGLIDGY